MRRHQKKHTHATFWIFMVEGKITESDTPTIQLAYTPSGLISDPPPSSPIFMPDALPVTILPIYAGLGQAPHMIVCIPGGLVLCSIHLIRGSLGPPNSSTQTASHSVQPFLHSSSLRQTDPTDRPCYSVGRIYVRSTARYGLITTGTTR